jgi:hypothetical protein
VILSQYYNEILTGIISKRIIDPTARDTRSNCSNYEISATKSKMVICELATLKAVGKNEQLFWSYAF